MNKKIDYIIVGQGLAGTFLAFQLIKRKKSFIIVDKGHENSSSFIAAGIINPIVLKRLTITWRSREFLKFNANFYKELETFLKNKYHFPLPLEKLVSSKEEQQFWKHRYETEDLSDLIVKDLHSIDNSKFLTQHFKKGTVKQTSWLNISQLLKDFRAYLKSNELLLEESFDYKSLKGSLYHSFEFKHIIFCEGAKAIENPFFNFLPFALNKGHLITLKSDGFSHESILKKKVFILPTTKNTYKVGATFSWKWENENIEETQVALLESQLRAITSVPYSIVKKNAGIRPASKDRRPMLGRHETHKNYYIFNGMGSKGCLLAPQLTEEFMEYIENGKALNPEMDIQRFKKLR